jgi:hypothetical protein
MNYFPSLISNFDVWDVINKLSDDFSLIFAVRSPQIGIIYT